MSIQKFVIAFLMCASLVYGDVQRKIDFPTSLPSDLQEEFIKGVILLHDFEYDGAREIFLRLQRQSPDFALAYWGEAMTYNHPLWGEQDLKKAQQALQKLGGNNEERIAKAKTPQEKGFIKAINTLYGDFGDKPTRDRNYAKVMYELYKQFPNDNEIATFYALALLGKQEGMRNAEAYMRAGSIANYVFFKNPLHPGAMHYFIHSVDDPVHAPLGLVAAREYAKNERKSPHALHMPSHIFLALGLWEEVVKSNQSAWNAIQRNSIDLHILQWLHYGHLQMGNFQKGSKILNEMYQIAIKNPSEDFRWYYFQLRAAQAIANQDFQSLPPPLDFNNVDLDAVAGLFYTEFLIKLSHNENPEPLIENLTRLIEKSKKKIMSSKNQEKIVIAEIILLEMIALNARSKQSHEAYSSLEKAIDLDNQMLYELGPPIPPKPAKELLADFYFEDKFFQKACVLYQEVLKKFPNRRESVEKLKQIQSDFCQKEEDIFFHPLMNLAQ